MTLPINYNDSDSQERREARNEYIELQNGLCWYCKAPLSGKPEKSVLDKKINIRLFPDSMFKWPVHLHHDHKTGMTIGAVHCHCNAVMWQYEGK